jgi:DNA-binding response OmpR family regulator
VLRKNKPFLEFIMKRRILLVDDELAILLTLRAILEMNDFEVETATSAKEAEQKMKSGIYHMVITDMRMETETAGYEVIRRARQQVYDPATAILTAYPTLGSEWRDKGAQSLLVKPLNTPELLRQIEALLITHQDHKALAHQQKTAKKVVAGNHTKTAHPAAAGEKAL